MTGPLAESLSRDPHPILRDLRATAPVSWIDDLDVWLVTSHQLCREVMLDPATFTVDDPRFSTQQVIGPSMLSLDGSEHRRHRDPFAASFRAGRVRELESFVLTRARDLIGSVVRNGGGDLRADVAGPLAVETMAYVLDLADVPVAELLDWYQAIVDAVHVVTTGGEVPESGRFAFSELHAAVSRNLSSSHLLDSVDSGGNLSVDEVVSNIAVLLFGGVVSAESSSAIALNDLLGDSGMQARLEKDPDLLGPFVEESFRLEPSAAVVDRYATRQVELGDTSIAAGDLVRVSLSGANRDPFVFPDPDRLDLTRGNLGQSLTFARGPHACLGIHLARLETRLSVRAVLESPASFEMDGPATVTGLVFRAPETINVLKTQ